MNQEDLKLLLKAMSFSAHKHRDQRRKDANASPYINHPIALANILVNEGDITDVQVLCAALLHDTVEDTDTTAEELVQEFGSMISQIVMEVTDDKSLPKAERKQKQIDHAAHMSDKAKLVKLADKISNLRDVSETPPAEWDLSRRQQYYDWAKKVIDQLRGVNSTLEAVFDNVFKLRPN